MKISARAIRPLMLAALCAAASLAPAAANAQNQTQAAPTLTTPRLTTDPLYIPYGGLHEFGGYVGHSYHAGPALGYVRNSLFTSVVGRYSYRVRGGPVYNLRWAPEVTLFADLFEQAPSSTNPAAPVHDLGGGLNPASFQMVFFPAKRVQFFIDEAGGILYYNRNTLSPGGTRLMFQVDYGAGFNFFLNRRNAAQFGFRYQHQSNANIGMHNPGTDAELFYVGFSHFSTKDIK